MAKKLVPVILYYLNFGNPVAIHWTNEKELSTSTNDIEFARLHCTKYGGKILTIDKKYHVVKYKIVRKGDPKSSNLNLNDLK